jgi:diguanylate cyclase (GGDEF)-like protein
LGDAEQVKDVLAEGLKVTGVSPQMEFRMRHADSYWRYLEARGSNRVEDPDVRGFVLNCRDTTERRTLERQLAHQAFHDSLTGLPNRALFMDRTERALARARRRKTAVAVLFMDLDNFKIVNDSLGHEAGDRLLVAVAESITGSVRPEDTVARFGGDEFTVLLEDAESAEEATRVAARVARALRAPFSVAGQEVFVTTSIGISLNRSAEEQPGDLLKNADLAMYRAKAKGKDGFEVFEPAMNARVLERLELENDLRRALESPGGELEVYYQPEVSTVSGGIVGFEALVRWEHPERGLLLPSQFVTLAEETGSIASLGRWALREACRQAREWQALHPGDPPLLMSVNLSVRQLRRPGLIDEVAEVLRETGLDPDALVLEITESVAMEDASSMVGTMRELKALGIGLAIDDFGTGYTSLSYLKRFPVDYLKIDRTFTEELGEGTEGNVIIEAIIRIAHALGLKVLAEGVEGAGQLARLRELGCDLVQGHHFSEPMPAEVASELLAKGWNR